tara:strand:+ start:130 stop:1572 length:1443 start_codon:yes stop_codon:yes gene_type:complete
MNGSKVNLSGVGIVHLGIGAFFRAFGLPQLQQMKQQLSPDDISGWDVVGVSFRSTGVRDCLAKNNFRYNAVEISGKGRCLEEINILRTVYYLHEQRADVMRALLSTELKMVTLTVTEKGYCYAIDKESVNWEHPQIKQDLTSPDVPNSVPGLLILALKLRREMGLPSFACVSCDNLVGNGRILKKVVIDLAHYFDPDLANWIDNNTPFPCSMVDRIVPAITAEEIVRISKLATWEDPSPVIHEPFRQWIIEDCFGALPRPPLEATGVIYTKDVRPYEEMKLRLLNATHSAIAYLGQLLGKQTVFEAVQDPLLANFISYLWELELCPSLENPPDIKLAEYTQQLMDRYRNPTLFHKTLQIAMDGSQKLPPRILAPIRSNLRTNKPIHGLGLVVAAWIMFLVEKDTNGKVQDISDPLRDRLLTSIRQNDPVNAILELRIIFGENLRKNEIFRESVQQAFKKMSQFGIESSLKVYLEDRNQSS